MNGFGVAFWVLVLGVGVLLLEAAVWYAAQAVPVLDDDEEEPGAVGLARKAIEAARLGELGLGVGFAGIAWSAAGLESPWAPAAVLLGAGAGATIAAALAATHWRSPLALAGRAAFRPLSALGFLLRHAVEGVNRLPGFRPGSSPAAAVLRADRELRWLRGRPAEDDAGRVLATLQEFHVATVEDVMVPRGEVAAIPATATVTEALEIVREEGFSRYPVYRESVDNVVGLLHVFDLLAAAPEDPVETLMREPLLSNATHTVGDLLRDLQRTYNQMAVVVDEFGGTAGVVTVEDLMEELVGEIQDETTEEEAALRRLEPGVYWAEASLRVDDLNESLGIDLEEGEYDTLAGLVLERLERIPRPGERIREGKVTIEVISAEPHRIRAVRLTVNGDTGRS